MIDPLLDIALLGGSFNPPHVGHLMAAVFAKTIIGCDEVWLVPSLNHPFGKVLAPFDDRIAMCELMGVDLGPWFKVSRAEEAVDGEGRTIELLEYLLPQHPNAKFRWIIGSDILADLPKWRSWDRIASMVNVTVLHRAGYPSDEAVGPALAQVSSSEIRAALERGVEPMGLVTQSVHSYIRQRKLYGL